MTTTELTRARWNSSGGAAAVCNYLGGRRGQIATGATIAIACLVLNWTWLVAAGVAPVLLSVLPCVAMCALGLCMNKMTGRACQMEDASRKADEDVDGAKPLPINLRGEVHLRGRG